MKEFRKTQDVLNEPLTVLNTSRTVIYWAFGVGLVVAWAYSLKAALGVLLVPSIVSQLITRLDPDAIWILPAIWRFQMDRCYDPCQRELFRLEVTEAELITEGDD